MKKFTLALSAVMMLGATAWAQEAETPVAKKLICKANFDAAAVALNQPHYLGVNEAGNLQMTNDIDGRSTWTISEPAEDGGVQVKNIDLNAYLYANNGGSITLSDDPTTVYFIDSPEISTAIGITLTKDASTNSQVFLNISGQNGNIATWSLDRGSSFFVMDYIEGDTDESVQQRVQAKLARLDGFATFKKYCDASSTGRVNKDYFVQMLEATDDADLLGRLADLTDAVMSYFISDLEVHAAIKSQSSGKYVMDPATAAAGITLSDAFSINSGLWAATDLNGIIGMSVTGATCRFKIQNVASGLYIGKPGADSNAIPVTDNAEEAGEFAVVAGADGLELRLTNTGVENTKDYLNAQLSTETLVVYRFDNDANAYWVAENLETVPFNEVDATFTGDAEDEYTYSTITGFKILVPRGATSTGIGSIKITNEDAKDDATPIYSKSVAEALNGITPEQAETTVIDWIEDGVTEYGAPNFKQVERTIYFDAYTIALPEAITEPGSYAVEVSANAFSVAVTEGETTTTKYTPELRGTADIPAPTFEITFAPENGTVDEIAEITLWGSIDDDNNPETPAIAIPFDINPSYNEFMNVTLVREWSEPMVDADGQPVIDPNMGQLMDYKNETLLNIDTEKMTEFFSFNDEDPNSPVFTIPVDAKAVGSYTFTIPEGFFAGDDGSLSNVVVAYWTIEVKDGIKTISNVRVEGNNIFDLQGRKVSKASKGVFIINGKKVLVK